MNIKIGCCGFPTSKKKYFEKFNAIELEHTFYHPPRLIIAERWRYAAPKSFEFVVKAWQVITHKQEEFVRGKTELKIAESAKEKIGHFKTTDEVLKAWEKTEEVAAVLRAKTILFESPASFGFSKENIENMKMFFRTIKRKQYRMVWAPEGSWARNDIRGVCEELDLVHSGDPFSEETMYGDARYFRLSGMGGYNYKYTGMDLKKLRDLCENETEKINKGPIYVFFNNKFMNHDAGRFQWIAKNTGRIKEISVLFIQNLCSEIEMQEEDENVQKLSQAAERIITLILHTDYEKVDIDIEKSKLKEMCEDMFPGKEYLYEMIYGQRFDRLWEQFRKKDSE